MQLAMNDSKSYAFLPSGILIVDPDPNLLAARSQLLKVAEHYVTVAEYSERLFEPKFAVWNSKWPYSADCRRAKLERLAQEIRLYWTNAYILVFGSMDVTIEERLYDDSIDDHSGPEELLSVLRLLQKGNWRQPVRPLALGLLLWNASTGRKCVW